LASSGSSLRGCAAPFDQEGFVKSERFVKSEQEVREMLVILRAFGRPDAVQALEWVLGLYPPPSPVEKSQTEQVEKPGEAKP
jgi:hypothetical protein